MNAFLIRGLIFGLLLCALIPAETQAQPTEAPNQTGWLLLQQSQGAAQAMVARLQAYGVSSDDSEAQQLASAHRAVLDMAARIQRWGFAQIMAEIPRFPGLPVSAREHPVAHAIAAYGTCALPLHPETAASDQERYFSVGAEFAVVLTSGFLRQRFIDDGGSDQQLKMLLDSKPMQDYAYELQRRPDQMDLTIERCQEFFKRVIG